MSTRRAGPRRHVAAPLLAAVLALAAVLVLAACNPPAPSIVATPSAPPTPPATATPGSPTPAASQASAQVYASIRRSVEAIRGLQPTADVDPVTIDEQQLRTNLQTEFDKENPADELRLTEDALGLLGLLPNGSSLRDLTLDFQAGQVAGYYSPDRKELFVVSRSGGVGPAEEVTYAHEFTHQLTDQRFDLARLGVDAANQSDRALAQLALIEGDAVSVQTTWTVQNLTPEEMGQLLQSALDPEALAALQRAPAYLRETALFPYQDGLTFVSGLLASGGYAGVDAAYATPPQSTEQILHPETYRSREAPVTVRLPGDLGAKVGSGWTEAGQDTLGELVLRLFLVENGVPAATATTAAAGWGGDRLVLLRGPDDSRTVGLRTEWDTPGDADEFHDAAVAAMQAGGLDGTVRRLAAGSKTVLLSIGPKADAVVGLLAAG